jgi:hypothetical protein
MLLRVLADDEECRARIEVLQDLEQPERVRSDGPSSIVIQTSFSRVSKLRTTGPHHWQFATSVA